MGILKNLEQKGSHEQVQAKICGMKMAHETGVTDTVSICWMRCEDLSQDRGNGDEEEIKYER